MNTDPNDILRNLDLDNIDYGFDEDDLENLVSEMNKGQWKHSGVPCRVEKHYYNGMLTSSWVCKVRVDWPEIEKINRVFHSCIWKRVGNWIMIRVIGDEEEAIEETEWLAEQVIMIENDSDFKNILNEQNSQVQ